MDVNSEEYIHAIHTGDIGNIPRTLVEFAKKWKIRPGCWSINDSEGLISFDLTDEIYYETEASKNIERCFNLFWDKQEIMHKYKKFKRSFLLHSLPGMGKSALIRHFCRKFSKKEGLSIIKCGGNINFKHLSWMLRIPYDDNVKSIVIIIEDMGNRDHNYNTYQYDPYCLNFLDGDVELFRVPTMLIVTTNFAKELGPQLINRPGRFNQIFRVDRPNDNEMFDLVENIGKITLSEKDKSLLSGKNLTPDHCVEILIRAELEEITLEESLNSVLKERDGIVDTSVFDGY